MMLSLTKQKTFTGLLFCEVFFSDFYNFSFITTSATVIVSPSLMYVVSLAKRYLSKAGLTCHSPRFLRATNIVLPVSSIVELVQIIVSANFLLTKETFACFVHPYNESIATKIMNVLFMTVYFITQTIHHLSYKIKEILRLNLKISLILRPNFL